jgi:hypothetical protein
MLTNNSDKYISDIILFHYGMVRERKALLQKSIDMQSWFFERKGVDLKLLEMKEKYGEVRPEEILPDSELTELKWTHPKFAHQWIRERS